MATRRRKLPILRLEGVVLLAVSLGAFAQFEISYLWALAIVLLPDLLFAKKFRENIWVERVYDLLHTYPLPSIFMFVAVVTDYRFERAATGFIFLWFAHIGFDRLIGRGAKYDGVFVNRQLALARQLMGEPPREGDEEYIEVSQSPKTPSKWGD